MPRTLRSQLVIKSPEAPKKPVQKRTKGRNEEIPTEASKRTLRSIRIPEAPKNPVQKKTKTINEEIPIEASKRTLRSKKIISEAPISPPKTGKTKRRISPEISKPKRVRQCDPPTTLSSTILETPVTPTLNSIQEMPSPICTVKVVKVNFATVEKVLTESTSNLETIPATEQIKAVVTTEEPVGLSRAVVTEMEVYENHLEAWEVLGLIDSLCTERLLDNVFIKSHKLCENKNAADIMQQERYKNMFDMVYTAYLVSLEYISYIPTPMYGQNNHFTELAVIANGPLRSKYTIPGLKGFTTAISEKDLTVEREFSIFDGSKIQQKTRVMLGPSSFVNHDCNPNSRLVRNFDCPYLQH